LWSFLSMTIASVDIGISSESLWPAHHLQAVLWSNSQFERM
jgi:hypothetical protein